MISAAPTFASLVPVNVHYDQPRIPRWWNGWDNSNFPTKSHVLIVLFEKQREKILAALREAEAGDTPLRELLQRFIHSIVEELERSQALTHSLLTAFVSQHDVRELMSHTLAEGRERIARVCAIGQERGEIRRDKKAAALAMTFQRSVLGTLLIWAMQSEGDLHVWLGKTLEDFWVLAVAK